jgi:hypothetical protein
VVGIEAIKSRAASESVASRSAGASIGARGTESTPGSVQPCGADLVVGILCGCALVCTYTTSDNHKFGLETLVLVEILSSGNSGLSWSVVWGRMRTSEV